MQHSVLKIETLMPTKSKLGTGNTHRSPPPPPPQRRQQQQQQQQQQRAQTAIVRTSDL